MKLVPLTLIASGVSLFAQTGLPGISAGAPSNAPRPELTISTQTTLAPANNPFSGSVPSNDLTAGQLNLSLQDAIQRGLRQNLGLVLGDQSTRIARAQQLQAHSALLPNLSARVADTEQQINLAAFGFHFSFPGVSIPAVVGPFNIFDARAYLSQPLLDFTAINNHRAAQSLTRAAGLNYRDTRDMVVQLVAAAYLQVVADEARVEEARSEVATAQALYQRAQDQLRAGIAPALDALRAQVELQTEQTRLRALDNSNAKDKLVLARLIGLPLQQNVILVDKIPYAELTAPDLNTAVRQAVQARADYQAASARVKAAEAVKRAAVAQRYPALALNADYGDIGASPWNSHGTFSASVGMRVSLFDSGRIRGGVEQADAELQQRKAELADLNGRIEFDVRAALLDLQTAADQVQVARSSVDVARQALVQAQDRFSAGVADNIEVVQAQNAVAIAANTLIDAEYAHNLGKVALARAMGTAEEGVKQYLGGR